MSLSVEIRLRGKGRWGRDRGRDGEKRGKIGEKRGKKGRRIYWSHGSNMTDKLMDANSLNSQVKFNNTGLSRKSIKQDIQKAS